MMFKIITKNIRFIKFAISGVTNTILNYAIYALLLLLNVNYLLAYLIAYLLATINSYVLNNFWVFQHKKDSHFKKFSKFLLITLIVLIIAQLVLYLFVDVLHITKYIAGILIIPLTAILNYSLYRLFVFR